jgi:hypothetical protein
MLAFLGNLLNNLGIRLPGGLHPEGGPYDVDGLSIPFTSIHSGFNSTTLLLLLTPTYLHL